MDTNYEELSASVLSVDTSDVIKQKTKSKCSRSSVPISEKNTARFNGKTRYQTEAGEDCPIESDALQDSA
ncbi:hypothetical protein CHS0354_001249 [Potamilus streckersoni]|uniref:Uncharacterized protein n=1 Tax=Potamilus streckersoni TaxID=2493646 RepID=A0AAE0VNR2_9BIVA|nr:hypothetical protein CHS0354_001249 [Potamilus streckersoni]